MIARAQYTISDLTDGRGVQSVKKQYYLSDSQTEQTGGSWEDAPPAWSAGKYMWTRSMITYTDDATEATTPYCDTGWYEAIGDVSERVSVNETDIQQLSDRIEMKVSETTYQQDMAGKVSQSQLAEVRQALTSLTTDKATVEFVQGKTDDLSAAIKALQDKLSTYFEFNASGYMEVGKRGNAFTTRLDNEKLAFLQNGQEVAYISNYEMLITVAKLINSMQLGGLKATVDAAGAVDWSWVGLG